jgi:Cft2 family RNA processing exonuclease
MEIRFLGAANTVTGSQFLLTTERAKILIDCGMFQGGPHEEMRNRVPLAYDPASLDAIILTHAHLDHCGLIPHIVAEGFNGPIYATKGTIELASLVLLDSGKLQEEFAKRHRHWATRNPDKAAREDQRDEAELLAQEQIAAQEDAASAGGTTAAGMAVGVGATITPHVGDLTPDGHVIASGMDELALHDEQGLGPRMGYQPVVHQGGNVTAAPGAPAGAELNLGEPVYDLAQAQTSLTHFRATDYEKPLDVAPGISAVFHDAGHILGSSIVELHVAAQKDVPARTLIFSGDLGRAGAPILRDPAIITAADYVLIESTYGGRLHEPEGESLAALEKAVKDVIASQGVLLIPSFAIGRTQEVVWALQNLLDAGRIPKIKLYLDSPMASKASTIYREHTDYSRWRAIRGHRAVQAAVRSGRLEWHAHGRARPESPPIAYRRPEGDDSVRRLSGRDDARSPAPGWHQGRPSRRPGIPGPLCHSVNHRLLRPRRRARAAVLARQLHRGPQGR